MKEIYIYSSIKFWLDDQPDTVIKGTVVSKDKGCIEIQDENGFTQLINLDKLFAVVY